ncbi:hypothetical protein D3C76_992490 [compost metagenome]
MRLLRVFQLLQRLPHAQAQGQRGLAFQRQVGQHVLHQRLLVQQPPANLAVRAVVGRLGQRLAHQGAGADHAVEAGHGHHFDDGRHAPPFFPDHPCQGTAEFHLAGGVGTVAQLVLQALDIELVAAVIRAVTRQQEAAQAFFGLGQGQKGIAHRRRAEPLVPNQFVGLARASGADRISAGGVGAYIGAALLLGHGHAQGDPGLVAVADVTRVVLAGEDFRQPVFGQFGLQPQRWHGSEGHGQRAAGTGLGLAVQVGHRSPRHMGAWAGFGPWQRRQAVLDGGAHQFVVGRVELDQVDAMAVAVVAAELRLVRIGQEARLHQRAASQGTVGIDPRFGPTRTETPRPFL